jgi:hypothetical protein
MAAYHRHPQPPKAPQPPDSGHSGLSDPQAGQHTPPRPAAAGNARHHRPNAFAQQRESSRLADPSPPLLDSARSDRPGDEPPRDSYGHQAVAPLSGLPLIRCSALLARPRRSPALSTRAGVGSWRSRKLGAQFGAQYERNRGKPRDRETAQECGIRPQPTRLRLVVVEAVAGSSPVAHPSESPANLSNRRIAIGVRTKTGGPMGAQSIFRGEGSGPGTRSDRSPTSGEAFARVPLDQLFPEPEPRRRPCS